MVSAYVESVVKIIATIISAVVCIFWMNKTNGNSGIGWFILSLLIIWA